MYGNSDDSTRAECPHVVASLKDHVASIFVVLHVNFTACGTSFPL